MGRCRQTGWMFAAVMAVACGWENTLFHRYCVVEEDWMRGGELAFELPRLQSGTGYQLLVDVRHDAGYPYTDLWLEVNHNLEDSTRSRIDTVRVQLIDGHGFPRGEGITGIYQWEEPIGEGVADGNGKAVVTLRHLMKDSLLRGITDLGVRVVRRP